MALEYWLQVGASGTNAGTEANPFTSWASARTGTVPDADGVAVIYVAGTTRMYDTALFDDIGVTEFQFAETGTFYIRNTSATPAYFTGRFDLSANAVANGITLDNNVASANSDDVWGIGGFDVTEGAAGRILSLLAVDYTTRRHLVTGQPYALCPRRTSIDQIIGYNAATDGQASITRTSNVATVTTPSNHGLRTGDKWTTANAADATLDVTQGVITVTGATTFTYASTGSDVGATAADGYLDESGFYYDEANDLIYARIRGSDGTQPDLIEGVWGGSGAGYNGINAIADQIVYIQGNIQVDCICPRSTTDGNPILATGGGKIYVQTYGGYEPEFWDGGDHIWYAAGDSGGGVLFSGGKCGGCASHTGDSIGVGYIASGSGSADFTDLGVSRPSIVVQSISLGYDSTDTDDPIPADNGSTYSGGVIGITAHTARPLVQQIAQFRYDGFTVKCNPRSFNRSSSIRGFTGCYSPLSVRDALNTTGPVSTPSAMPGVFTNFEVHDAVVLDLGIVRQGMAFANGLVAVTGADAFTGGRAESSTQYSTSNGCIGQLSQATESRTLLYNTLVVCNAYHGTATIAYRLNRSSSAAAASRYTQVRWERSALLFNANYASGTHKLIDLGGLFISGLWANLASGGSLGADDAARTANARYMQDFMSCGTEFVDSHVGYIGRSSNTGIKLLGSVAAPELNVRQLSKVLAFDGGYAWGVTASAYATTGENITGLSTAAAWNTDAMTATTATWAANVVTYNVASTGLYHPCKVGSSVRISGSSVDVDGQYNVATTPTGLQFTYAKTGSGTVATPGTIYTGFPWAPGTTAGTDPGYGTLCWAVTAASRTSNLVTVTVASHGIAVGDRVAVQGITPHSFCGVFTAEAVTATTVSYRVGYSGTTSGTVDGTHGQITKLPRRPLTSAMRDPDEHLAVPDAPQNDDIIFLRR